MNHLLQEITPWVTDYGLWVVFFGMIFEGTTMIVVTGILCYLGMLPLKEAIIVAIAGAVFSDQLWYVLGKNYAAKILARFPRLDKQTEKLIPLIKTKGDWLAMGSRFVYSGAILFPVTLGMKGYSHTRFTLFDLLGVTIWVNAGIAIGYFLGTASEQLFGKIKTVEHLAIVLLVIIAAVWWYKKRRKMMEL